MQPGSDCLALEVRPDDFQTFQAAPFETFMARFNGLQGMAARLKDVTLEGKLLGTRGVENYFRTPYGPGWALTGDAGYCRDPSTGSGISDSIEQSFLLGDALHAALDGGDWDASLADFQQKRDALLMPSYQSTVSYTKAPETVPESVAWLRRGFEGAPFGSGEPQALDQAADGLHVGARAARDPQPARAFDQLG